jgi:hypothetical protein
MLRFRSWGLADKEAEGDEEKSAAQPVKAGRAEKADCKANAGEQ